jgi:hypothetical protein
MPTIEKTNGTALPEDCDGDRAIRMPEDFAGLYDAGYETGLASGRESAYRQAMKPGSRTAVGRTTLAALSLLRPSRTPPKSSLRWARRAFLACPAPSAEG